jgi:uncharacterized protein YidB (DUF937 family)
MPALISQVVGKELGSLQGIVNQLQQDGLGAQVQSWLGNGPNQMVTPARVTPVQTAMRNCTRDEGRPFGFGDQVAKQKSMSFCGA